MINETHDSALRSWLASANDGTSDFPVQNLPIGVFKRRDTSESQRVGIAIGDCVFDVSAAAQDGAFDGPSKRAADACSKPSLNALMALGQPHWSALRLRASELLRAGGADEKSHRDMCEPHLVAMADADLRLPADIGDYTDFYASVYHATNVGSMFRPDNPLLPNYKHVPIAYHGRASSIVLSGTPIRRPSGQTRADDADAPVFGPSKLLDYELEVGFFVGPGNSQGKSIAISDARGHIFGLCVVNDWSARDMQKWEYQPLGPFLAKSFATTVSPWVVTLEALAPFRVPAFKRLDGDPTPLPYLTDAEDQASGGIDMTLAVYLDSLQMRERGIAPMHLSTGNFRDMYWTISQMITHHASNGCNLRPGDLIATGTISGPEKTSRGCLLELTWRGSEPLRLPTGEERKFLQDGDELTIRAWCEREGHVRIGFGECTGAVLPART